ncbi:protein associated with UVRAG as autophagy enhancer [Salvelinus sp. IW2-2015]|uniref:protein associated with UVRAG as autophagy enhancer n=1 Tax=Salvelinus sp. IW2-2015 TaxID=2691554 RepID=UPI000CDFF0A4|nr:protein RUBCNL-like [Salvelinus alpinus]XP_023863461.1 protein RUBCNL-like [Salvelinus alpinus]
MDSQDIKKVVSRGTASPLRKSNYVSWYVDTVPASPYLSPPHGHCTDTESSGEEKSTEQSSHDDDDDEGHFKSNEAPGSYSNREDPSLLTPGDDQYHLPRSSPVISRRRKSLTWHGDTGLSLSALPPTTVAPLGLSSDPPSTSDRHHLHLTEPPLAAERSTGTVKAESTPCPCPAISQSDKPRCVSISANLNRLLTSGLHLPFRGSQGPGLDQEEGPRLRSTSDAHPQLVPIKDKRSSDITHCSADIIKTGCDLDKENAHFIVVDMVLEALEGVKWAVSLSQKSCGAMGNHTEASEDSGAQICIHPSKTHSLVSTDSGYEGCGANNRPITRGANMSFKSSLGFPIMRCSAEGLAQQLVCDFRKQWFPTQELKRGRQSIRTSLQELPGGVCMVSDVRLSLSEEIRQRTRMRGTLNWAPPRFQIIFSVHPTQRRSEVVASQHFLCAGCGTEIEPRYIKKLRYCEYLSKYFCDCCHGGAESVIPGRVLTQWDFGRYPVSDFSKQLLDSVWHQPLFDLTCVGKTLYSRVRELDRFRDLQEQLLGIKRLLKACRLSEGVLKEFEQLPDHLTQEPHLFSMDDLLRVKRGQLVPLARAVLRVAIAHVENCQVCLARGFICEFCKQKDVLFPFQSETCTRCQVCKACFHKDCFRDEECPKCARIQCRKKQMNTTCL